MIVNQETIQKNLPFILKWSKKPTDSNGAYNPGWKQATESDRFLEIIENTPTIFNDIRFITMDSIEEDISYMRVNARFQSMKELSGDNAGAQRTGTYTQLTETVPAFSRSKLVAEPFSILSYTAKTFLLENIEKASFLPHIEARLAEEAGYSAEIIAMYGKRNTTNPTTDGVDHIDGVFKQLTDINTLYNNAVAAGTVTSRDPMGYYKDIDASKPLVKQVKKMITQFTKQKGKRSNAILYVSSEFEGLLIEEADQRPTERGDNLYFQDGQLTLWGVPIKQSDILDNPENGFGEQILLCDPNSIVAGFLGEIESENAYVLEKKAYLSTVDSYFDVLILYNKDVLAAKVVANPSVDSYYFDCYSESAKTTRLGYGKVQTTGVTSNGYMEVEVTGNTDPDWVGNMLWVSASAEADGTTAYQLYSDAGTTALDYWVTITEDKPVVHDLAVTVKSGSTKISGATVNVMWSTGTTGNAGGCTIKDVKEGNCWISVSKEGYTTYTGTITVDSTHTTFNVNLTEA